MPPELLEGVLLPAGVAGAGLIIAARPWKTPGASPAAALTALAFVAGFAAAFVKIYGFPQLPPPEHWRWLLPLAVLLAAVWLLGTWSRLPRWVRYGIELPAALGFAYCVIPAFEELDATRGYWWMGVVAMRLLVHGLFRYGIRDLDPRLTLLTIVLLAGGTGGFLVLAHTARFAQIAGILAAVAGAGLVVALWRRSAVDGLGLGTLLAGTLLAVVLLALFYDSSDVPQVAFGLAGLAPAGAGVARLALRRRMRGKLGIVAAIGISIIPLIAAAILAASGGSSDTGSEYEYGAY
jgi:hypothetical protein